MKLSTKGSLQFQTFLPSCPARRAPGYPRKDPVSPLARHPGRHCPWTVLAGPPRPDPLVQLARNCWRCLPALSAARYQAWPEWTVVADLLRPPLAPALVPPPEQRAKVQARPQRRLAGSKVSSCPVPASWSRLRPRHHRPNYPSSTGRCGGHSGREAAPERERLPRRPRDPWRKSPIWQSRHLEQTICTPKREGDPTRPLHSPAKIRARAYTHMTR